MKNWYISSTGDGLSLTIKGLSLAGFVPVITLAALIARQFGFEISDDAAVQVASLGLMTVSMVMTLAGLIRKAYLAIRYRS